MIENINWHQHFEACLRFFSTVPTIVCHVTCFKNVFISDSTYDNTSRHTPYTVLFVRMYKAYRYYVINVNWRNYIG